MVNTSSNNKVNKDNDLDRSRYEKLNSVTDSSY